MVYVGPVRPEWWVGIVAGALLGGGGSLRAEITTLADSPYRLILDRNPFGLKPPPTNVVVQPTSPPPAQINVNLSGISAYAGIRRAWLVIPPGGTRTNATYLSLAEGEPEREGIKVESIDVQQRVVRILKQGSPATLDFETSGLAYKGPVNVNIPGMAKPAALPGRPGAPVPVPGVPAPTPAVTPRVGQPAGSPAVVNPSAQVVVPQATAVSATASPTLHTIPSRNLRTAVQEEPADPAIQYIQLKAQELDAKRRNIPFPPTPPIPGMEGSEQ